MSPYVTWGTCAFDETPATTTTFLLHRWPAVLERGHERRRVDDHRFTTDFDDGEITLAEDIGTYFTSLTGQRQGSMPQVHRT